jgi:hypothetical protein
MIEVKAIELELVKEFEGFHLARYNGDLGIWKLYTEKMTWNGEDFEPCEPVSMAYQLDDDCNHLLEPEWEGLFECRVLDIKAEMNALAAEVY